MKIKDMFKDDIDRTINGVVQVEQEKEEVVKQEVQEYVVTTELNKKSGFLGMTGYADCRDVEQEINNGSEKASLALDMYCNRIAEFIGKYYIELEGNVDSIVFTAGVGENGPIERKKVLDKLSCLGIKIDDEKNNNIAVFREYREGIITTEDSKVRAEVLPTNEEIMIVKDAYKFVK